MKHVRRLPLLLLTAAAMLAFAFGDSAQAAPKLRLDLPRTVESKTVKFRSVAKGLGRKALVEIQVFRNGLWTFHTQAKRGTHRGTLRLTGDLQQTRFRLAVRKQSRENGAVSEPRTVRWMGRVPFADLFGDIPQDVNGQLFASTLYGPIDVSPKKSACSRLNFTVMLAYAGAGQTGTLTVTQAGRASQTITVANDEVATLPVRLTPNRAYRIEPAVPAPVASPGDAPRLLINGDGFCFSRQPLPHS